MDLPPKLTCLLPSAVLAMPLGAQTLFPIDSEISESPSTDRSAAGDLNGDGVLDLILYSRDEAAVKLMAGEGGGAYDTPVTLPFWSPDAYRIEFVDLDNDGRTDLLFESQSTSETRYRWARQVGPLEFQITDVLTIPWTVADPVLTDFSLGGSGNYAIVAERQNMGIDVHRWNGTEFEPVPISLPYAAPRYLRLLDVNEDGMDDVTAYDHIGQRWRYSSYLGGNQFSTPRSFLPIQVLRSEAIELADLDGDGDSDLIALSDNDPTKYFLFERTAAGTFGPPIERFASNDISRYDLDAVDLDGDGRQDLQMLVDDGVFGGGTTYEYRWLRNLGGFHFAPDEGLGSVPFADLDNDGAVDAIVHGPVPGYRTGGGISPDPWYTGTVPLGRPLGRERRSFPFDTDGDGDLDIVREEISGGLVTFENRGGLNFAPARPQSPFPESRPIIAKADFVGDAELDILAIGDPGGALVIERGIAPGVFAPPVVISSALNGTPYPFDVDGDGDLDVIQSNEFPGGANVYFIENSGIGTQFPRRVVIGFQEGTRDPIPLDLDGDGLPELVALETSLLGIGIRQNLGGGNFGPPVPLGPSSDLNTRVYDGLDFDSDGDTDLIASRLGSAYWAENLGLAGLAPLVEISQGDRRPTLEDVDGNGLLDIVQPLRAEYRLQTSPGVLSAPVRIAPRLPSPQVQGLADLDGDGDLDAWLGVRSRAVFVAENFATPSVGGPADECAVASPNSTGLGGELRAYGSDSATSTDLRLSAVQLPPAQFGFFVGSREVGPPAAVPGSAGSICLRGSIGRYIGQGQVQSSGTAGTFSIDLNPSALLTGAGPVPAVANETWFFQAWHRDVAGSGAPTNQFTNALGILFTP